MGEAEEWIRAHVEPTGPMELVRDHAWAQTWRVPTGGGVVWFKACGSSHRFEAELVRVVAESRPDLLPRVVGEHDERGWLLLADAGVTFESLGNRPELWVELLPAYAELQRDVRVPHAVPDRGVDRWPELYDDLLRSELPLAPAELARLRGFAGTFAELSDELLARGPAATIQHDDLHHRNAYRDGTRFRVIDWGDSCRSHPFTSLFVPFRFLEEHNELLPDDPWFARLRDAYLEPWGRGLTDAFHLSQRLAGIAHCFGWVALRRLLPEPQREAYDRPFQLVLRRAFRNAI